MRKMRQLQNEIFYADKKKPHFSAVFKYLEERQNFNICTFFNIRGYEICHTLSQLI